MRPIVGIATTGATGRKARGGKVVPASEASPEPECGRALIAVTPPSPPDRSPTLSRRPDASFLAQLIATAEQMPQTRSRRRIDPDAAIASYRATAGTGAAVAHRLVRSC
jgi:hypothetical protein